MPRLVLDERDKTGREVRCLALGRDEIGESEIARMLSLAVGGASRVLCWLPERHPYRDTLRGCGFVDAREAVSLVYRPGYLTAEAEPLLDRPGLLFHYTLGDSDFV